MLTSKFQPVRVGWQAEACQAELAERGERSATQHVQRDRAVSSNEIDSERLGLRVLERARFHRRLATDLFQPPREQRREGEAWQKIRQFHPADLENHQRNGARDQAGGGIDRIHQTVRGEKRLRVKLAGEVMALRKMKTGNADSADGQPNIFTKPVMARPSITALTASS